MKIMNEKDKQIVQDLETKYDDFLVTMEQLQESLDAFNKGYKNYLELNHFYGSKKWLELYEQSTEGIKCGILSQDQLYDFIIMHNELISELLELATKMYKNI